MSSHHVILGIVLIVLCAGVLIFLLGQPVIRTTAEVPFKSLLATLGVDIIETQATSTHVGKVVIDFVSLNSGIEGVDKYVRLRMIGGPSEYIGVSGWTIASSEGSVRIPFARDFKTVRGLEGVIFLRGGGILTLYEGESPSGENVRISEREWAAWVETLPLAFPHGLIILSDEKGERVSSYSY